MIKSIQNDGEFEGGKAMMHIRGCALMPVLLWSVRTLLKHKAAGRKAATKLRKVVTKVVIDWISSWTPKHRGLWKAFFIGEQNRRSTKTLPLKKPAVAVNGIQTRKPNMDYKKGTLMPPTPWCVIWVPPKNFSQFFVKEFLDETRYRSAISAAH